MISIYQLLAFIAMCCGYERKPHTEDPRVPYIPDIDYIHYHNGDDEEGEWIVDDWYADGLK